LKDGSEKKDLRLSGREEKSSHDIGDVFATIVPGLLIVSSIINHQSSTINHQPSIVNHQSSIINQSDR